MTTTTLPRAVAPTAGTRRPRLILLGGVPGAGKTTLLQQLATARPGIRALDPDRWRRLLAAFLPAPVPYRAYRPLVHTIAAVHLLALLLRGPSGAADHLVVHDPATRAGRRLLTGWVARACGWDPVLVLLDVPRDVALTGQHERGRVVPALSFERHWRRWEAQRARWAPVGRAGAVDGVGDGVFDRPWSRELVVDRGSALPTMLAVLRRGTCLTPTRRSPGTEPAPTIGATGSSHQSSRTSARPSARSKRWNR